jgi:hygromycin-B 7''-O-kinase
LGAGKFGIFRSKEGAVKGVRAILPDIETRQDYVRVYRDADTWLPAMRVICQRHRLDATRLEFAPPGSHVIFQVQPERYIKLFSPLWGQDFVAERLVLRKLSERSDLPVPRLLAEGEIEGWPYAILTAVQGVPLCQVWEALSAPDRAHVAARCGEFMAALHATQTQGLEALATHWPTFVEAQTQDCIHHLAQSDLDEKWRQATLAFLGDLPPLYAPGFQPVLLSADVTDEHLLLSQRGGRWELTGYVDFGDAMLGHPLYEFAAPGCCITRGSPDLQRAMLLAYGYAEAQLNSTLAAQLMAYTLLHRFINIPELLKMFGSRRPASFEELKSALWSFASRTAASNHSCSSINQSH